MYEYLQDRDFLLKLDRANIREHWCKLTLLSFAEEPIKEIQGLISGGSLNVNGSAAIRRTISLTMIANEKTNDLENIDNLIKEINKEKKELEEDNSETNSSDDENSKKETDSFSVITIIKETYTQELLDCIHKIEL